MYSSVWMIYAPALVHAAIYLGLLIAAVSHRHKGGWSTLIMLGALLGFAVLSIQIYAVVSRAAFRGDSALPLVLTVAQLVGFLLIAMGAVSGRTAPGVGPSPELKTPTPHNTLAHTALAHNTLAHNPGPTASPAAAPYWDDRLGRWRTATHVWDDASGQWRDAGPN